MRFRSTGIWAAVGILLLSGCSIHDEGRFKTSEEAVNLASELSAGTDPIFNPMLENLAAAGNVQDKLRTRDDQSFMKSFEEDFPRLTAEELAQHLLIAISQRIVAFHQIEKAISTAVIAVNDQLDRQSIITNHLRDAVDDKSNIEVAIDRIKNRITWIEGRIEKVDEVRAGLSKPGNKAGKALSDTLKKMTTSEELTSGLEAAKKAINAFESDEQFVDAKKLLKEAADEIADSEMMRLQEMQRHLREVKHLREMLQDRDRIAVCSLYIRALERVYPGIPDSSDTLDSFLEPIFLKNLDQALDLGEELKPEDTFIGKQGIRMAITLVNSNLNLSGRYDDYQETFGEQYPCFEGLDPDPMRWWILKEEDFNQLEAADKKKWLKKVEDFMAIHNEWLSNENPASLKQYVAADIAAFEQMGKKEEADGPVLVATLGIFLQHEERALSDALLSLGRELHKHSIIVSAINGQQRASLVHQLSQGLRVYYQGGVKPEEVAQLVMLAGQVGALTFIGAAQ